MAYLLLPISLFIKNFSTDVTMYYIVQFPLYSYLFLILIAFFLKLKRKEKLGIKGIVGRRVLLCSIVILVLQFVAMMMTHFQLGDNPLNRDPFREYSKLIILSFCVLIHYLVVRVTINNHLDIKKFIQGSMVTLIILSVICFVQLFYMIFPNEFQLFVSFFGHFEYHFDRNWYFAGSYVQTQHRINGLNPESDYLAIQLFVVFVPLLLSALKNKYNIFPIKSNYNRVLYFVLILSILSVMFFAKTSTGLLTIILVIVSLLIFLPKKYKIFLSLIVPALIILIYLASLKSPLFSEILNKTLLQKLGGYSILNRLGGTYALILTWLTHPIIGVGFNFHDFYTFKYLPDWAKNNFEFHMVFKPKGYFPILSVLFGWLAELGTIFVIMLIAFFYRLVRDLRRLMKKAIKENWNVNDQKMICMISDYSSFFFLYAAVCSLLIFNWYESMYLIMIFFFVVVRQIYLKKLSILEK